MTLSVRHLEADGCMKRKQRLKGGTERCNSRDENMAAFVARMHAKHSSWWRWVSDMHVSRRGAISADAHLYCMTRHSAPQDRLPRFVHMLSCASTLELSMLLSSLENLHPVAP
jgi:hypothetical protein